MFCFRTLNMENFSKDSISVYNALKHLTVEVLLWDPQESRSLVPIKPKYHDSDGCHDTSNRHTCLCLYRGCTCTMHTQTDESSRQLSKANQTFSTNTFQRTSWETPIVIKRHHVRAPGSSSCIWKRRHQKHQSRPIRRRFSQGENGKSRFLSPSPWRALQSPGLSWPA
jgi:hypothetical protein